MVEESHQGVDESLIAWCRDHQIIFGPIRSALVPNGWRGIVATDFIPKDTCVLRVPRTVLLSCDSARGDDSLISHLPPSMKPLHLLALHLLNEMSKMKSESSSFYTPYLKSLPAHYTTGMCLSEEHIEQLQAQYAKSQLLQAQRDIETDFTLHGIEDILVNVLKLPPPWCTREKWLWALSTLSSRTMHYSPSQPSTGTDLKGEKRAEDEAGCLTPFGDLFNYQPPPAPYTPQLVSAHDRDNKIEERLESGDGRYERTSEMYCIYARRDYKPGEEIFLCYGRYTNLELLEHYGFVMCDEDTPNPHDIAVLPQSAVPKHVMDILKDLGANNAIIHANGNPSWEFLRALRLSALTDKERKARGWKMVLDDRKVDDTSERTALEILKSVCRNVLNELPTTLEEDECLLSRMQESLTKEPDCGGIGGDGRGGHCVFDAEALAQEVVVVQWRVGYKRILGKAISMCVEILGENKDERYAAAALHQLNIRQPKLGVGGSARHQR